MLLPSVIALRGKAEITSNAGKQTTYSDTILAHVDPLKSFHNRLDDCATFIPNAEATTNPIDTYAIVENAVVLRKIPLNCFLLAIGWANPGIE